MDKYNNTEPIEVIMKSLSKKVNKMDAPLSHNKCPLVVQWEPCTAEETQEITGFASRQKKKKKKGCEEFTATATHLEMMSSGEKNNVCFLSCCYVNRVQGLWL